MMGGLSAAEVLSGGLRNVPKAAFARALTESSLSQKNVSISPASSRCGAASTDGPELVATAAGALLGLHNEPV